MAVKSLADARKFFDEVFPMLSSYVDDTDLEEFAKKTDSKLPTFSFVGPSLHKGKSTCLVGDAIHTVKPFFGSNQQTINIDCR